MEAGLAFARAGAVIDGAALGLIGLALLGALVRRLDAAIWLLAAQGGLLSLAAGAVALYFDEVQAWWVLPLMLLALAVGALAMGVGELGQSLALG